MSRLIFGVRTVTMRGRQLATLQGGLFLCQFQRCFPEDKRPANIERLRNVPRASGAVRSDIRQVAHLSAFTNSTHNVKSTQHTTSTGGNLATSQIQGRNSNSTIRAARKRAKIQKRSTEGVRSACAIHARHSFAKLISPKLFTSAYPCSLRVGIGMTTR